MRLVFRAMCAVALAGCSDAKPPVETKPLPFAVTNPLDSHPAPTDAHTGIDPRPIADRLDALFGARLSKVNIPADGVSQASDAVHPDMACPPDSWNGARCWLMYTPYKNSDPSLENPAVLYAASDTTWMTPIGVKNPIIAYPGSTGYNSDPDHAFDPVTRRMVQVYRVVADTFNKIMIMSTANAQQWTIPALAFREKNHDAVSPALIIEPDRTAKLWYVRAGVEGCAAASSSVQLRSAVPDADSRYERSTWSAPTPVSLAIPGYVVWHLDVIEIAPDVGYLALIAAYPRGTNCATSDLWLASSSDGLTWRSYPMPILWRSMPTAKQRTLSTWYRGTLRYNRATDSLDLWPSALSKTTWNVYHARVKLADILGLLDAVTPGDFKPSLATAANAIPLRMP
jgi:hypothetical protein